MLSVMSKTLIEGRQIEQTSLKKLDKEAELMRSFPLPLKTADDMLELEKKLEEDDGVHAFLVSAITAYCRDGLKWSPWRPTFSIGDHETKSGRQIGDQKKISLDSRLISNNIRNKVFTKKQQKIIDR